MEKPCEGGRGVDLETAVDSDSTRKLSPQSWALEHEVASYLKKESRRISQPSEGPHPQMASIKIQDEKDGKTQRGGDGTVASLVSPGLDTGSSMTTEGWYPFSQCLQVSRSGHHMPLCKSILRIMSPALYKAHEWGPVELGLEIRVCSPEVLATPVPCCPETFLQEGPILSSER